MNDQILTLKLTNYSSVLLFSLNKIEVIIFTWSYVLVSFIIITCFRYVLQTNLGTSLKK